MRSTQSSPKTNVLDRHWLLAAALAVLLLTLGSLQYRWLTEVSAAEQERLQTAMDREGNAAVQRFEERIAKLAWTVGFGQERSRPGQVSERLETWRAQSDYPELVERVLLISATPEARRSNARREARRPPDLELAQLDAADGQFKPIAWTPELRPLVRSFMPQRRVAERTALGDLEPTLPAIVLPAAPARPPLGGRGGRRSQSARAALAVVLDRTVLTRMAETEVLEGIEAALGDEFSARLVDRRGQLFLDVADPDLASAEPRRYDLFRLRPPAAVRDAVRQRLRQSAEPGLRPVPAQTDEPRQAASFSAPGLWVLEIAHRDGTLEAAVAKTRLRNMGLSAAILGLLAVVVLMLLRSAARDRQLAQRQTDFVAGLTHELHTPLAAISSAGANLADGVVADQQRVREYGEMLKKEGARLNQLVGQALQLAGVESPLSALDRVPLAADQLLRQAVERVELYAHENDCSIAVNEAADEATINADQELLLQALTNLLTNSIKYGASAVELDQSTLGEQVKITVTDNGPGVPRKDVAKLFEPFMRGDSVGATTSGAGLGLHLAQRLVERHGGRLRYVDSNSGGACFEITLPLVAQASISQAPITQPSGEPSTTATEASRATSNPDR